MTKLSKETLQNATELINAWFYDENLSSEIEAFLRDAIDLTYQTAVESIEDRKIRTEQNQLIQFMLKSIDNNPLSVRDGHTSKLRRLVWQYSGINCDDFSKLDIRGGVRFDNPQGGDLEHFNPNNISILTGGNKCLITGLRGDTYLDGSGKVIIYGSFNCASGVNIFTHDHEFKNPNLPLSKQKRKQLSTIIYPECFIGESSIIFGNLHTKTTVAATSITRANRFQPPFSIVGGVGANYGVIRTLESGEDYPPTYLDETIKHVKDFSEVYGAHLEDYVKIVGEYLKFGNGCWDVYQERISVLEKNLFEKLDGIE